jgi:hypothetical protein
MRRFHTADVEFWPELPGQRSRIAWFPAQDVRAVPDNRFMSVHWERDLPDGIGEIPSTRRPRGNVPEYESGPNEFIGSPREWMRGADGFATLDPDTGLPISMAAPKRGLAIESSEADSLVEFVP